MFGEGPIQSDMFHINGTESSWITKTQDLNGFLYVLTWEV